MARTWLILCMALAVMAGPADVPRTPVLVELFTSEGCSSCPPADELLARLEQTQPIAGAEVVPLELHVDYWNRLGWTDPFSSSDFSRRQQQYSKGVYTPQMVVDGVVEFVGNDGRLAHTAIREAARRRKAPIRISPAHGAVSIAFEKVGARETADVVIVITENRLQSNVVRGENAGRKLAHAAVVRKLTVVGKVNRDEAFFAEPVVNLLRDWKRENVRVAAFVQERGSRRILAAGVALFPID